MKLKLDWLVLRVGVNGRFLTITIPVPRLVGILWEEVVGVLLFGSFVALLSLGMYRWATAVYLVAWITFFVFIKNMANEMKADPEARSEWRNIMMFAPNPALLEAVVILLMSGLWPVTFLIYIFHEWFD
jgi:hypothetical protein